MVLAAVIFFVYALVFFFRAFSTTGFELGVETLNGVTSQQLNTLNPAIMGDGSVHSGHGRRRCRSGMVRGSQRPVVGVDNGRDLPGVGLGRGLAAALHGTFQLRLGEPSRADLCRHDRVHRGSRVALIGLTKAAPTTAHASR
jgi:hypothetical protein